MFSGYGVGGGLRPASGSGNFAAIPFAAATIFPRARSNSSSVIFPSRWSWRRSDSVKPIGWGVLLLHPPPQPHHREIPAQQQGDQHQRPPDHRGHARFSEDWRDDVHTQAHGRRIIEQLRVCVGRSRSDTPATVVLVGNILRKVLSHPLTRGIDLDDPRTTALAAGDHPVQAVPAENLP